MIYADPSYLFSFYAMDANSAIAARTYSGDQRRPLIFTPWQRFELRNAVRQAIHRLRRGGQPVPFQRGVVFNQIDEDLSEGILRHHDLQWRDVFPTAEALSEAHTEVIGLGAVDLWHIACAILIGADTFWTF